MGSERSALTVLGSGDQRSLSIEEECRRTCSERCCLSIPVLSEARSRAVSLATNTPWMVFEVHEEGVVVVPDSTPVAKVRYYLNMLLLPLTRPIPFLLGQRVTRRASEQWVMPWQGISRVTHSSRWCLTVETPHGASKTFRFRTTRGLQKTLSELRKHDVVVEDRR